MDGWGDECWDDALDTVAAQKADNYSNVDNYQATSNESNGYDVNSHKECDKPRGGGYNSNRGYDETRRGNYNSNRGGDGFRRGNYNSNREYGESRNGDFNSNRGYDEPRRGGYNSNRGYDETRRGNYNSNRGFNGEARRGGYNSNIGNDENRRGNYNSNRGYDESSRGNFNTNSGDGETRRGGYNSNRGYDETRRGNYNSNRGYDESSRGNFNSNSGDGETRRGGYNSNRGYDETRRGDFNSNRGFNGETRRGGYNSNRGNDESKNEFSNYNRSSQRGYRSNNFENGDSTQNDNDSQPLNNNSNNTGHFESKTFHNSNQNDEETRKPVTYIPPEFDESEQSVFSHGIRSGINFGRYKDFEVKVTGSENDCSRIKSFDELQIESVLQKNIERSGYTTPTPIQQYAIPLLLKNNDIMACAQTGSGKTAAFVIPIINGLLKEDLHGEVDSSSYNRCCKPLVLIIVPTRELVLQTFAECKKFSYGTRIRTSQVYGGVSMYHQLNSMRSGCEIIVGTTGRLLDVIRRGALSLDKCVFLVLDEADRMLDMGFEPDVRAIIKSGCLSSPGSSLCTAMFSATFPKEVQTLAQDFLHPEYSFITVGVVGGACQDVEQIIVEVNRSDKRDKLNEILSDLGETKTLIFVEQKRFADFLASNLNTNGFRTTSIHGDRLQQQREEALRDFVHGNYPYLVATSVAARGLDIPGIENVINYDLPDCITEYVHRIGRTGRCGNVGKSISFFDSTDDRCTRIASSLVSVLRDAKQKIPPFLENNYGCSSYEVKRMERQNGNRQDIRTFIKTEPVITTPLSQEDCWD